MKIQDLITLKPDSAVEGQFIISEITLKPFSNKEGDYLSFILQDRTGKVYGKIWDDADEFIGKLHNDTVVFVKGMVNTFNGKHQITVGSIKNIEDYNVSDFIQTTNCDIEQMYEELVEILRKNIKDENIKLLLEDGYLSDENFIKKFKKCPGGKGDVHHAYIGGLLEHTLGVVLLCVDYSNRYKDINSDILIMGAFLHDLGKMLSYEYKVTITMTDLGRLHGHTALGYNYFLKNIDNIDIDRDKAFNLKMVLGHLILSHNGEFNGSSFVLPMTKEAILLSNADSADADVNHITKILSESTSTWSNYDKLRGRMYFKNEDSKVEL